jgi:hypothetical protein
LASIFLRKPLLLPKVDEQNDHESFLGRLLEGILAKPCELAISSKPREELDCCWDEAAVAGGEFFFPDGTAGRAKAFTDRSMPGPPCNFACDAVLLLTTLAMESKPIEVLTSNLSQRAKQPGWKGLEAAS